MTRLVSFCDHHVGGLDDGHDLVAYRQAKIIDSFVGDGRGDDDTVADMIKLESNNDFLV